LSIDEGAFEDAITESQDLQVDALRDAKDTLPDLADIGGVRRDDVNTDEIVRYNASRRQLLQRLGLGAGALASRSLVPRRFRRFLGAILASPASADTPLDVQILQTASSLEVLAITTYGVAITLPFIQTSPKAIKEFATRTMQQHNEHKLVFQAQTKALGGQQQTLANPVYAQVVQQEAPKLTAAAEIIGLVRTLETVATETYLENTSLLEDAPTRAVMARVMGVESQHAAVLAAFEALLKDGASELIQVPFSLANIARLPAGAGSIAFPEPFEPTTQVATPESGAVK